MKESESDKMATTILLLMAVFVILAYIIMGSSVFSSLADFTKKGPIGDFFSGVPNPIIGFGTAALLYFSFRAQIEANKMQKDALEKEKRYREKKEEMSELETKMDGVNTEIGSIKYVSLKEGAHVLQGMQGLEQFAIDFKSGFQGPACQNIIDCLAGTMIDIDDIGGKIISGRFNQFEKIRMWERLIKIYVTKISKPVNTILLTDKESDEIGILRKKKIEIQKLINQSDELYAGIDPEKQFPVKKNREKQINIEKPINSPEKV